MILTFWLLLFLIFYCYLGYPILIWFLARTKFKILPRNQVSSPRINSNENLPIVSVIIAAHNEADIIQSKISNLLSLDYPKDRLEILIGSDGSTDRTTDIIQSRKSSQLKLIANPLRQGKIAILNQLVPLTRGEIILFTDARQMLAMDAVKRIVSNFQDPRIGCVSGELMFQSRKEGATSSGVSLYWRYEKFIRLQESLVHSMLGATGAIYAIRKELYTKPPMNIVLDDMFIPLNIILKGYRAIFDLDVKAYDQVAANPREEYTRKVRTLFGNYQIFSILPGVLNPGRSPIAFQMISHKLLRVLIPFFLIAIFILNLFLIHDPLYKILFVVQIIFYSLACIGNLAGQMKYGILRPLLRVTYIPYTFCLLNFSALMGFIRFLRQNQDITWEKARKHQ